MILGIKVWRNKRLICKLDYSGILKIKDKTAEVFLPSKIVPEVIDNTILRIGPIEFDVREHSDFIYNSNDVVHAWNKYSSEYNLDKVALLLLSRETFNYLAFGFIPATPRLISIARLPYIIKLACNIPNFNSHVKQYRSEIRETSRKGTQILFSNFSKSLNYINQLEKAIASLEAITSFAINAKELGYDVEFSDKKKGYDMLLNGIPTEVKHVHDSITKLDLNSKFDQPVPLTLERIVADLATLLYRRKYIQRAIEQNAKILSVDVTSTVSGAALAAYKSLSHDDSLSLKHQLSKAIDMAQRGKFSVIFYTRIGKAALTVPLESISMFEKIAHVMSKAPRLSIWSRFQDLSRFFYFKTIISLP